MNLIDTGTDPWILEYDACEKVAREIMVNLNLRDNEKMSTQNYNALSAKIRIRLKQFGGELKELQRKLNSDNSGSLTHEERERRQRQVEHLLSKEVQLQEHFNREYRNENIKVENRKASTQVTGARSRDLVLRDEGTTSWGEMAENQNTDTKTIDQMREEQQRLLKEQDKGLESLLKIVTAQTQIARTINNEVEHHNEILVDIADGMERVDGRMNRATQLVHVINKKESIWGYWLVAFLLFITILGVAFA